MSNEKNFEEFSAITALILGRSFSNFPIASDIDFNRIAQSMGLSDIQAKLESGRVFQVVAAHTLKWLMDNDYVRAAGVLPRDRVSITDKGLAGMRAKSGTGISFGEEIEQKSTGANTSEGRRNLAEVIGSFVGSAAGSFTKSLSGG
ncbi:MAG: hypothetical protein EPO55_05545 [Reyranella sp.]|uniref:hypothetical protein n=1 Tax=Reyranella sp. TaxID=1929291 RepID=UPI0011F526A2|nr:hypothetical protein [Reyranella sp.]TAJ41398.1 MAG: hypothetical protein EPO55_05545 [Reyranella sp.]